MWLTDLFNVLFPVPEPVEVLERIEEDEVLLKRYLTQEDIDSLRESLRGFLKDC